MQDVLRDTWLAWVAGGREEVGKTRADLARIAVNQALSWLRRARRSREAYVAQPRGAAGRHRAVPGRGGAAVCGRAGRGPSEQGDQIRAIYGVVNPDKLTWLAGALREHS
jgi:hypothetical protein